MIPVWNELSSTCFFFPSGEVLLTLRVSGARRQLKLRAGTWCSRFECQILRGPTGALHTHARGSDCRSTEQVKEALYPDRTSCLLAQRRRVVSVSAPFCRGRLLSSWAQRSSRGARSKSLCFVPRSVKSSRAVPEACKWTRDRSASKMLLHICWPCWKYSKNINKWI